MKQVMKVIVHEFSNFNNVCEKEKLLFLAQSDPALVPMAEDAQKRASMQDWKSFPYFWQWKSFFLATEGGLNWKRLCVSNFLRENKGNAHVFLVLSDEKTRNAYVFPEYNPKRTRKRVCVFFVFPR